MKIQPKFDAKIDLFVLYFEFDPTFKDLLCAPIALFNFPAHSHSVRHFFVCKQNVAAHSRTLEIECAISAQM